MTREWKQVKTDTSVGRTETLLATTSIGIGVQPRSPPLLTLQVDAQAPREYE